MADDEVLPEGDKASSDTEHEVEVPEKPQKPEVSTDLRAKIKNLWAKYLTKKKLTIPLTAGVVVLLILLIPTTRLLALGTVLKQNLSVVVTDSVTHKPVSSATVKFASTQTATDKDGKVTMQVKVSRSTLFVEKKYFKAASRSVSVDVLKRKIPVAVEIEATGRQVPVRVTNKITGKGLENITVKAADSEAKTDQNGEATLVVPAGADTFEGKLAASGYNDSVIKVKVTEASVKDNEFTITPTGKLYFLSKLSGKIDVVKTDLDGGNRKTVLAGTGLESDTDTILLASRDWKYLVLKSKREGKNPKVYVITTVDDKLVAADEGDADFTIYGWSDNYLVYLVNRNVEGQAEKYRLKSYNAATGKIALLDKSEFSAANAEHPYSNYEESFVSVFLVDSSIYYFKTWNNYYGAGGFLNQAVVIKADNSGKKVLGKIDSNRMGGYAYVFQAKPHEFYASGYDNTQAKTRYFEWEIGDVAPKEITNDGAGVGKFSLPYPTYVVSPSGNNTFWSESRDGKPQFFTGNQEADNSKNIGTYEDGNTYGWYTDSYVLISKKGSELYIAGSGGGNLLKVTDYHKPAYDYRGYGGGYGGF